MNQIAFMELWNYIMKFYYIQQYIKFEYHILLYALYTDTLNIVFIIFYIKTNFNIYFNSKFLVWYNHCIIQIIIISFPLIDYNRSFHNNL